MPIRRLVATLASNEARLDRFLHTWLAEQLRSPVAKAQVRRLLMAGAVRVDGIASRRPARPLGRGARIEVRLDPNRARTSERPPELGGRILYEDAALIAVDKPAGLAMHPSADRARPDLVSGLALLLRDRGQRDYLAVHQRLDRETSGVVLLAKLEAANSGLAASFAKREVVKLYQALTRRPAALPPRSWRQSGPLGPGGPWAETDFRLSAVYARSLLVEARPLTGRKHQLRIQLAGAGLPILGDRRYGVAGAHRVPRLLLHARSIALRHPVTGVPLHIEAPLPPDFEAVQEALGAERLSSSASGRSRRGSSKHVPRGARRSSAAGSSARRLGRP